MMKMFMDKFAVIFICEQNKKNVDYLVALRAAFLDSEIDTVFVSNSKDVIMSPTLVDTNQRSITNLSDVIAFTAKHNYNEIVIFTDDFMGPVLPLDDFLRRSDSCTASIWRLTRDSLMFGCRPAVWDRLAACSSVEEVARIFDELEDRAAELYNTGDILYLSENPMMDEPVKMICEKGCPFFLHMLFHAPYDEVLHHSLGYRAREVYDWLCRNQYWDVNLLWNYLLPSCHQDDYYWNLHLRYILPTRYSDRDWAAEHLKDHRLALAMHLYYEDKFDEAVSFAKRFPEGTHVIAVTNAEEKREKLQFLFDQAGLPSFEIRRVENRGRDVAALFIGIADTVDRFEYICFYHDKKTLQTTPGTIGLGFTHRLQENLFPTRDFINNVIRLFSDNPRLGLVSPPPPHHSAYIFTLGTDWGPNYEITELLYHKLGYTVPISPEHMPLSPLGTCFWFRSKAFEPVYRRAWSYSDFPEEPLLADGTLLHAIERIHSFTCVQAGYYPAYLMSDRYAAVEHTSMRYYVEGYNKVCTEHGMISYQRNMRKKLVSALRVES